jgi:hypothetical protein
MNAPEQSNQAADPATGPQESTAPAQEHERPEGPAAAALLAAGVGSAALGLLTTLAEVSESFKDWLALTEDVGPLSGKTTYAVGVWLVAWAVLHWLIRPARVTRTVLVITAVLIGLGVLGTFPVFFEAFAPE